MSKATDMLDALSSVSETDVWEMAATLRPIKNSRTAIVFLPYSLYFLGRALQRSQLQPRSSFTFGDNMG